MKWIADMIISVAKLLCKRAIDTYFTPQRAMVHRVSDMQRWHKYQTKAKETPGQGDDKIAEYLRIRLKFDDIALSDDAPASSSQ